MAARKFSRAVTPAVQNPELKPKNADDGVSVSLQELRFTLLQLRQARSLVTTATIALVYQNADMDADIAAVLQHSLGTILCGEITRFEKLLGEGAHQADPPAKEGAC